MSVWTPEVDQILKDGRTKGDSFTQIAKRISRTTGLTVSRNACIGRAKRTGLTLPAETRVRLLSLSNVSNRISERQALLGGQAAMDGIPRKTQPLPDFTRGTVVLSPNVKPWTERHAFGECAWPIDPPGGPTAEMLSCCNRTLAGKSYCADHAALMFVKPKGNIRGVKARANQIMEAA